MEFFSGIKEKQNLEKQKEKALKQFEKLYSNPKNNQTKNANNPAQEKDTHKKIKAKFKKNNPPNFMDIFFKDQDKTLIIILIVMLMDNEENLTIIMILIYLLV